MNDSMTIRRRLRDLIGSTATGQGAHFDPAIDPPPDASRWPVELHGTLASDEFELFKACLCLPGDDDVRAGVIDDLAVRYELDAEEVVRRAVGWERWSVEEWSQKSRDDPAGLRDFYRSTVSWSFDLLWYAYLQAEGFWPPLPPAAVRFLAGHGLDQGNHLDLGSGVGVTSQIFAACGYVTTLADVADELLDFARFRLDRRGTKASYLNLNDAELPTDEFDVITALDVLAHVPDPDETLGQLAQALRPGGWLLASFDARLAAPESAWHLCADEFHLRAAMDRAGFVERGRFGWVRCYQLAATPEDRKTVDRALRLHSSQFVLRARSWGRRAEISLRPIAGRQVGGSTTLDDAAERST